jgi:hypothetical protein
MDLLSHCDVEYIVKDLIRKLSQQRAKRRSRLGVQQTPVCSSLAVDSESHNTPIRLSTAQSLLKRASPFECELEWSLRGGLSSLPCLVNPSQVGGA